MKEKITLRESTMKAKSHWLEIEKDGSEFYVSLRNASGILGGERTPIKKVVLESLTKISPGVIIKNGPLRFFRTEDEMRVSFNEMETQEGLSGYDEIDEKQFMDAIDHLIGGEKEEHAKGGVKKGRKAVSRKS